MELFEPALTHGTDAEIDDPEVGQARGNQQAREPGRITEMARVQVKATTFLIREKGLDVRSLAVVVQGMIHIAHIRHEVDRRIIGRVPDRQQADRPVSLAGHPRWRYGEGFAARWLEITDVALKSIGCEAEIGGGATDVLPAQVAQRRLQFGAIKLAITEKDDGGRGRQDQLQLGDQRTMDCLGEVAFAPADDDPD